MKTCVVLSLALGVALPDAHALADDALETGSSESFSLCASMPDGSCARFEGYIYVRRGDDGDPAGARIAAPAGSFSGDGRLYVHAGAPETPDR